MRSGSLILLLAVAVSLCFTPATFHRVTFVYDGDTIRLENGSRVRYLSVDSPEIDREHGNSHFMAEAARDFNRRLVDRSRVRLAFDREKRDHHGRLLAYVYLENGQMINLLLVQNGLAHVLLKRPNLKHKSLMIECQRKAMREKIGIWNRPLQGDEEYYIGNRRSYRFHRPTCPFGKGISPGNHIRFHTLRDAYWEGHSPCKRCLPHLGTDRSRSRQVHGLETETETFPYPGQRHLPAVSFGSVLKGLLQPPGRIDFLSTALLYAPMMSLRVKMPTN
jgi:micrococcal nuclease